MYRLATMQVSVLIAAINNKQKSHKVTLKSRTGRQTDRQSDNIIMPIAD